MATKQLTLAQQAVVIVALYARFSVNHGEDSESVQAQLIRGREEAARMFPGCVVKEYADDGISGTTDQRPDYQRMLADMRRGLVQVVLAKNQSRIERSPEVWERFRVVAITAGIEDLHTWGQGIVGLATGRSLPGRLISLINAEYAEQSRLNILDNLAVYASQGKPPGGSCLGYTRGTVDIELDGHIRSVKTLVPVLGHIRLLTQTVDDALGGVPISRMTERFNDEKIPTPRGGQLWRPSNLRRLLRSPTLTALRIHVPEAKRRELRAGGEHFITLRVAQEHGNVYEGIWEPIIEREKFLSLQRMFDSPGQVTRVSKDGVVVGVASRGVRRGPNAKYLLSGCARCGRENCGHSLTGTKRKNGLKSLYICHSANGGCDGLGVNMDDADAEAERQFLGALESAEYRNGLAAGDPYVDQRAALLTKLERIEAKREQDREDELLGDMSREEYKKRGTKADELKVRLMGELGKIPEPVGDIDPDILSASWAEAKVAGDVDALRRILKLAVDHVEIKPATRTGRFDPDRVKVHMRTL